MRISRMHSNFPIGSRVNIVYIEKHLNGLPKNPVLCKRQNNWGKGDSHACAHNASPKVRAWHPQNLTCGANKSVANVFIFLVTSESHNNTKRHATKSQVCRKPFLKNTHFIHTLNILRLNRKSTCFAVTNTCAARFREIDTNNCSASMQAGNQYWSPLADAVNIWTNPPNEIRTNRYVEIEISLGEHDLNKRIFVAWTSGNGLPDNCLLFVPQVKIIFVVILHLFFLPFFGAKSRVTSQIENSENFSSRQKK